MDTMAVNQEIVYGDKSSSIGKLADALSKAQGIMEGASKDAVNPHFGKRYADLASIWAAARVPLASNGLAVIQTTAESAGKIVVVTTLAHSSGEWMSGRLAITPVKLDPQGVIAALTYARRGALAAIVGVCPEDDDGNSSSHPQNQAQRALPPLKKDFGTTAPAEPSKGAQTVSDAKKPVSLDPINEACKPIDELMGLTGITEQFIIDLMNDSFKLDGKALSIADLGLKILQTINTQNGLKQLTKRWNDRDKTKYPSKD